MYACARPARVHLRHSCPRDRQNHPCNDKWKRHDQNYGIAHGASPFLGLESLSALFTVNVTTEDELAMNGP